MDAPENRPLVFSLSGSTTGGEPTVLGLWTVASTPSAGGLAFSAPAEQAGSAVVWQVDLPPSPYAAARRLQAAEASLSAYPWAMAQAQARMDVYTAPRQAVAGVSFGLSPGSGPAERELDSLMLEIAQVEMPASYGLREAVGGGLTQAAERFQAFLDGLAHQLTHYAWVETRSQGQMLACTVVGWRGDARTHWQEGIAASKTALHRRTVALALGSRLRLLETLAFVSRNALRLAKLPVLLGIPGGAILALPLAWNFVNDVRLELSQLWPTSIPTS